MPHIPEKSQPDKSRQASPVFGGLGELGAG